MEADLLGDGIVVSTLKRPESRGERKLASTRQTDRELLAARVRPALAQIELLPFLPSTPQKTTCRRALPLVDRNIRCTRRNISSPPTSPASLGATAFTTERSATARVR